MITRDDIEAFEEYDYSEYERDMWLNAASVEDMVTEFHLTSGQDTDGDWYTDHALRKLRDELVEEEMEETLEAKDPAHILKELADLVYVAVGYAVSFGWQFDEAFRRVHESNMSKFAGGVVKDENGKVMKSKHYVAPDLEDLV